MESINSSASGTISQRIYDLRKRNGLTQQELAEAVGVKRETINHWESGTRQVKAAAITSLAAYFNVTSDYLLGLTEESCPDLTLSEIAKFTGLSVDALLTLCEAKHLRSKPLSAMVNAVCVNYKPLLTKGG